MIRVEEDRVFEVDVDVMEACIKLQRDKFLRQRTSRRVAVKRLCKRDLVCVEEVHSGWVVVALFLIFWFLRIQSNSLKVCCSDGGTAVPPSPQELETTLKSHDHLTAVSHQQLIHSKSTHCVVGSLSRSGQGGVVSEAIRPSPGETTVKSHDHLLAVSHQQFIMSGDVETNPGPLDEIETILSTVDDTTFDENDWNIVIKECSSLSAKWEHLSGYLGLSISLIDSIKENFRGEVDGCWSESLKHWIRQNYQTENFGLPSWRSLLEAVAKVGKRLFKKLADTHQAVGESATSSETKFSAVGEEAVQASCVCPESSPDAGSKPQLTFPCLDLSKMSKEEKQQLHQRLYAESMDMVNKFQDLFSATTQSLKVRKVSVKELLCHLVGLGPLPPVYDDLDLPLFRRHFPELTKSKKIDDAMLVIGNYCSFFNFCMIEHIINKLGTRQDMKNLSKYKEQFSMYAMRLVFEFPAEVGTVNEGLANMFVTLDETFDSCTVRVLELFVENLRKVLKIPPGAVFKLCRIAKGSLKLTFQLSFSVIEHIFPLSDDKQADLIALGVLSLRCEQFHFNMQYLAGDLVSMTASLRDKREETRSNADSGHDTHSVISGATSTGVSQFSEDILERDLNDDPYLRIEQDAAKLQAPDDSSGLELHQASYRGDLEEVKRLIKEEKLNPLQKDSNGDNALHYAAMGGHLPVAKYLIEEQSLVPACTGQLGLTPLHFAAYLNNLELVNYLVAEQQVDPQCQDEDGCTPLHQACSSGDVKVVQYLVNEMSKHTPLKDVIYDKTKHGSAPLHLAASHGHLPVVKLFITEFNIDPNTPGFKGRPPLHDAAQEGHLDTVKYLVEEIKCDPSYYSSDEKVTPLHMASQNGHLDVVKYLTVDKQCNPLNRDSYGNTSLHLAAHNGHFKVAEFFISRLNCDPNTPGWQGRTPLHDAAQGGHLNIVKYLIEEKNCNPSCLDKGKSTPLHVACGKGHLNIAQYLTKEQHCNPLYYDRRLGIPLHWAACYGQLEVVKYFIEDLKCPQNIRGVQNTTPLERARRQGHTSVVQYLISVLYK